jgi:hypothetical protein
VNVNRGAVKSNYAVPMGQPSPRNDWRSVDVVNVMMRPTVLGPFAVTASGSVLAA